MKALVLDTSAFITGFGPDSSCRTYTVSGVINEIKNRELKLKVELFLNDGSLKLTEPSKNGLSHVKKVAEKLDGKSMTLREAVAKIQKVTKGKVRIRENWISLELKESDTRRHMFRVIRFKYAS